MGSTGGLARFLATVGGLGRSPWAPGTLGSSVGLGVGCLTVSWIGEPLRWLLILAALFVSVEICTRAEQELGQRDPPAIILDEVWAMAAVVIMVPGMVTSWGWMAVAFVLFRLFDITKFHPVGLLSRLPRGWGVVGDDLGAAMYTVLTLRLLRLLT